MFNKDGTGTPLNREKITGLIFNPRFIDNSVKTGCIYINKLSIRGYEIVFLSSEKYSGYLNYFLRKNPLNSFFCALKNKKQTATITDCDGNPLYCINPFYQFRIHRDYLTVCCDIVTDENVDFKKNKGIMDIWYGDKFDKIREGIRRLDYSQCDLKKCYQYYNKRDWFFNLDYIRETYPETAAYLEGKTEKYRVPPAYYVLGFDSTCNLSCKSCTALLYDKLTPEEGDAYVEQIRNAGRDVERLMIAGFGDPFASPIYRKWLFDFPCESYPNLKLLDIMTNGILLNREAWNRISKEIKKCRITLLISIDGVEKETYEINRKNARFETLINNLDFIAGLRKTGEIMSLILCFTIQKNNYKELPNLIAFAKKYSFDSIGFTRITNWGTYSREEFDKINVFDPKHPEYRRCRKIIRDMKKNKFGIMETYLR